MEEYERGSVNWFVTMKLLEYAYIQENFGRDEEDEQVIDGGEDESEKGGDRGRGRRKRDSNEED